MTEFIITTPDQLRTVVAESVKTELERQFQGQFAAQPKTEPQSHLLTRKQAAFMLGVSLPTLNEWSKKGVINAYRIASRVRYKSQELEQSLLQFKNKRRAA
jgi:excisionase family DNA binding protein